MDHGRLRRGLDIFGKQMRGYITEECNLIGFETVLVTHRIPRENGHFNTQRLAAFTPAAKVLALLAASSALHSMVCVARRQQQKVGAILFMTAEP